MAASRSFHKPNGSELQFSRALPRVRGEGIGTADCSSSVCEMEASRTLFSPCLRLGESLWSPLPR